MAMRKCKECDTEISKSAKSCPKCGWQKPKTGCLTQIIALMFASAIALFLLVAIGGRGSDQSRSSVPPTVTGPEAPPPPKWVSESCSDLAKQFGLKSKLTDLQKDAAWEPYKDAHFKWKLKVVSVDTTFGQLQAQFKCERSRAFSSDILLRIGDEDKGLAIQFTKGAVYTIHGTLQSYGNFLGMSGHLIGAE